MRIVLDSGEPLELVPRPLCLEFTNTVGDHASEHPREFLNSYTDLVDWARRAGVLEAAQAQGLLERAAQRPAAARAALRQALVLREAIYGVFVAHIRGNSPPAQDVHTLGDAWAEATAALRLEAAPDGLVLRWGPDEALDGFLRPVAVSAAELLMRPDLLARVGQCSDADGCGWLFLDLSKNHSRRWCDMRDCGNRAKARRFTQRNARA